MVAIKLSSESAGAEFLRLQLPLRHNAKKRKFYERYQTSREDQSHHYLQGHFKQSYAMRVRLEGTKRVLTRPSWPVSAAVVATWDSPTNIAKPNPEGSERASSLKVQAAHTSSSSPHHVLPHRKAPRRVGRASCRSDETASTDIDASHLHHHPRFGFGRRRDRNQAQADP